MIAPDPVASITDVPKITQVIGITILIPASASEPAYRDTKIHLSLYKMIKRSWSALMGPGILKLRIRHFCLKVFHFYKPPA